MDERRSFYPFDDEEDRIPNDDEMYIIPEQDFIAGSTSMDEEEARSYSSVYDMPVSSKAKNSPKQ